MSYFAPTQPRAGGRLKTWATTIKADLGPLSGPRVLSHARWRQDWEEVSSEFAQHRRAWSDSFRDVVNAIGDAGSARLGWMPTQVSKYLTGVELIVCFTKSVTRPNWMLICYLYFYMAVRSVLIIHNISNLPLNLMERYFNFVSPKTHE